jgi:nephrocystin-3
MATADDHRKSINIDNVWNSVKISEQRFDAGVDDRPGWKTVRIFVSSTFKDFHQEREVLIKQVFADLRAWCEQRRIHLIDCDLRWGVPKETTSELVLRTCMEEIDRCYENNRAPYFLNMTCKRIGWIPMEDELPKALWDKYQLVFGLSVTEMEIVHAAYRIENPNALFLIRDDTFLDSITDEKVRKEFIDELKPTADQKLEVLKKKITSRYPQDRVVTYKCEYCEGEWIYTDYTGAKGRPKLKLDDEFSTTVLNFFKDRIEKQYPIVLVETDVFEDFKYHHDAFMTSRSDMVFGREDILKEIGEYIEKGSDSSIKLILGESGFGKSSIMAKAAFETLTKAKSNKLLCRGSVPSLPWTVFYHFVGAVPNSTSLVDILRRILKEMQPNEDLPETLEEIGGYVKSELLNDYNPKPTVIFIDAVNQIDKEQRVEPFFWLPDKLSKNVRIVLSMIPDSDAHTAMKKRKDLSETRVPVLPQNAAVNFAQSYLQRYNKKLDAMQLTTLVLKSGMNPLWLKIACEELRIYGDFNSIDQCINDLKGDSLSELLKQVLQRFERETDGSLLTSTLCLLKASKSGLLEIELREILADKDNLEYKGGSRDIDKEPMVREKGRVLPAFEWTAIYRNLRVFLLPFGNPSECRLNFYHSKLSEVVQEMYFEKGNTERLWWWHKKLADYYSLYGAYDRRVEEYPYHLLQLKKYAKTEAERKHYCKQLETFIGKLDTVKRLYDHEFSGTLLEYWRETGDVGYKRMTEHYVNKMNEFQSDLDNPLDVLTDRFDEMSRLLVQASQYKEGMDLATECLELIGKLENGLEKDKKLMYIYGHIAHIKSLNQNAGVRELDEMIGLHEKAIALLQQHRLDEKDKKCKRYLALQLIKIAYARGLKASLYDSPPLSVTHLLTKGKLKKELKEQGLAEVKRAITIYTELKDFGHELEAQLTKATLKRESKDKQLKIYTETLRRCEQLKGVNCPLMCRLCFNMGVVHGRANEHVKSYVCRKQAYIIAKRIYGPEHKKTEKYKTFLLDIVKEAKKKSQDIEVMADDEVTLWKALIQ